MIAILPSTGDRLARLPLPKGAGDALHQVELQQRREFAMANGEERDDVAKALIAHVLNVTAGSLGERTRTGIMTRLRTLGEFQTAHHVFAGLGASEIVDVWHGKKVFSARRDRDAEEWEIVNFKRGDWESGFLCAA